MCCLVTISPALLLVFLISLIKLCFPRNKSRLGFILSTFTSQNTTACPQKKPLRIFREDWMVFSKNDFEFLKLVVYLIHVVVM